MIELRCQRTVFDVEGNVELHQQVDVAVVCVA